MKIGIIAAMTHEIDELRNSLENCYTDKQYTFDFYCGNLNSNEVVVVESGMGKGNAILAATLLVEHFSCRLIINTGIAGGVSPLNTNDVVVSKSLTYSDFDARALGALYGQVPGLPKYYYPSQELLMYVKKTLNKLNVNYVMAPIYTSDKFISSFEQLNEIKDEIEGAAIEMEGAGVAQAATRLGVDFIVIRYISDIIGKENQIDDYHEFEIEASNRSALITKELIKNIILD